MEEYQGRREKTQLWSGLKTGRRDKVKKWKNIGEVKTSNKEQTLACGFQMAKIHTLKKFKKCGTYYLSVTAIL